MPKHSKGRTQQQMMLPFPSINVGQQYLPECPNEMPPNQLKKCQILQIAVKQTKNQFGWNFASIFKFVGDNCYNGFFCSRDVMAFYDPNFAINWLIQIMDWIN